MALAVLVAACSKTRAPEQPVQATNDCARCHGNPPPANGPFIVATTTSHPVNPDCHLCHPGTVGADNVTIVAGGLHMDGVVESTGHAPGYSSPAAHGPDALRFLGGGAGSCTACHGTDYAGGSTGKSCNACHAAFADDWQTNCTFCHGTHTAGVTSATALVAPPQSVSGTGAQDSSNPRVGAHQAHLAGGTFSNALPCSSCHTPPTDALGHFAGYGPTSSVVPVFGALARTGVTGAYAGGTCSVYCHGSGSEFTVGGATKTSPAWTATTIACGDCHALPPPSGPSYPDPDAHTFHVTTMGLACSTCHPGYAAGAAPTVNLATHVNGQKDVVVAGGTAIDGWNCNACHAALGVALMHAMPFTAQHAGAALNSISGCADCHGASYGGAPGVPSCNGCHESITASAPDWRQNCSFCHGTRTAGVTTAAAPAAPPSSVAGTGAQDATNPKVGAHQAHLADGTFSKALACGSCHTVPAGGDLTHFTGWSTASSVTPAFDAVATKGVASPGYAAGSCAVYCHGSGTEFANAAGTTSPLWTATGSVGCGSCHAVPPDSGPIVVGQNAHPFHVGQGATCGTCHGAGYSTSTVDTATHVNGAKDVVANGTVISGWNCAGCHTALGISHPAGYLATHTPDALADIASCTSCHGADYGGIAGFAPSCTACHADATTYPALAPGFPDWKTNCTFCHGTRTADVTTAMPVVAPPQSVAGTGAQDASNPKVGAHQAHLADGPLATAFTCGTCHSPTPTDPLGHFAGWTSASSVTPAFSPLGTQGVASPAYASGSCAVYCHGSGTSWPTGSVAANPTPAWTSTGLACNACHATRPTTGGSNGHNGPHATTVINTVTVPTPCEYCHLGYAEGATVDPAYHVNGTRTVIFTSRASGNPIRVVANPGWATSSCPICHSTASGNVKAPAFYP